MRTGLRNALLIGLTVASAPALCADDAVPIEQEPQHRMKFSNAHVRLFDVLLPPGYISLWHSHVTDGVFVNIEPSETREEVPGAKPSDRPPRLIGQTYFTNYTKTPKVHRVSNTGTTPYHVVDAEIVTNCGGFAPVADAPGQTLILDNERVRVTRLMIGPGETVMLHPLCGMLLAVDAGNLAIKTAGGEETIALKPAEFKWRDQGESMEIRNAGSEVFQAVDVVVK